MKYINGPMGFFAPCDTYVRWDDYAALAAENERLRKAGEMLFECIEPDIDDLGYNYGFKLKHAEARAAWHAAKEGRDAK